MLVRIVAGRVTLRRVIWSDPEVFCSEVSALEHAGFGARKRQNVFTGHKLVTYRLADMIENGRIDHLPKATGQRVDHPLCLGLRWQEGCFSEVSVAVRVFGTRRLGFCIYFVH